MMSSLVPWFDTMVQIAQGDCKYKFLKDQVEGPLPFMAYINGESKFGAPFFDHHVPPSLSTSGHDLWHGLGTLCLRTAVGTSLQGTNHH